MEENVFRKKLSLVLDPYFDREFFTNLIYCIDRKKTTREIFEAAVRELNTTCEWSLDSDKALLHLFFAYQASSLVREDYQWLPLSNALYASALHRGDGQKLVKTEKISDEAGSAATPHEFESLIRQAVRGVESKATAWNALLFLLENRSTRSQAISILIREASLGSDVLTFELLTRALEVSLSSGWKATSVLMRRPFDRFWKSKGAPEIVAKAERLSAGVPVTFKIGTVEPLSSDRLEELWLKISKEGAESAWGFISKLAESGISFEQISSVLVGFRGRLLFAMKTDQWAQITRSIAYAEALQAAAALAPDQRMHFLATNLFDLVQLAQILGAEIPARPTGSSVLDGTSKNISKDRLVLRLEDAIDRGERSEALELMAVILKDEGLSSSVADRLLLVASKQDSWTYDLKTLPVAFSLTKAYGSCIRLFVRGDGVSDVLYGLLRFFCDQRMSALSVVPKTGTYGNGLSLSQYDVSGGARIVDRFVFNQMRNAQRVKIWPSDN